MLKANHGLVSQPRVLGKNLTLAHELIDEALGSKTEVAELSVPKELDDEVTALFAVDAIDRHLAEITGAGRRYATLPRTSGDGTKGLRHSLETRPGDHASKRATSEIRLMMRVDEKMKLLMDRTAELTSVPDVPFDVSLLQRAALAPEDYLVRLREPATPTVVHNWNIKMRALNLRFQGYTVDSEIAKADPSAVVSARVFIGVHYANEADPQITLPDGLTRTKVSPFSCIQAVKSGVSEYNELGHHYLDVKGSYVGGMASDSHLDQAIHEGTSVLSRGRVAKHIIYDEYCRHHRR